MADISLQLRGGTEVEHASFTGAAREVTVDTTNWVLQVHDGVTAGGHTIGGTEETLINDDRYYTETEIDALLVDKSDTSHTHGAIYYTETEVDALLADKSDTSHTHGAIYYTETEVDALLADKSDTSHAHAGVYEPADADIQTHITTTSTPHITATQKTNYDSAYTHSTSSHLALGSTTTTAHRGDQGAWAYLHANEGVEAQTALGASDNLHLGATRKANYDTAYSHSQEASTPHITSTQKTNYDAAYTHSQDDDPAADSYTLYNYLKTDEIRTYSHGSHEAIDITHPTGTPVALRISTEYDGDTAGITAGVDSSLRGFFAAWNNSSAAGLFVPLNKNGTAYYLWVDATGNLRGHSTDPATAGDTAGVVIADLTP